MYSRPHHQRIQKILESLDAALLLKNQCLFGGGTAIVLACGEFRESADIDFMVSSVAGYRELRGLVNAGGIHALMLRPLPVRREARIDQYGIRCAIEIDAAPIKLEIVFEGRVALADPLPEQRVNGVWVLTHEDQVAAKLMANSDRWADDSTSNRDLIDLAMLSEAGPANPAGLLAPAGVAKAVDAYGPSVVSDFEKARAGLLERDGRLATCMKRLKMTMPQADLRSKIERLALTRTRRRRT